MQVSVYYARYSTGCSFCGKHIMADQLVVGVSALVKREVYHYLCFMRWAMRLRLQETGQTTDEMPEILVPDIEREGVYYSPIRDKWYKETERGWEETVPL